MDCAWLQAYYFISNQVKGGGHANMMKKWILRFIPFWTAEGMYFQKKKKKLKKITNWQPSFFDVMIANHEYFE